MKKDGRPVQTCYMDVKQVRSHCWFRPPISFSSQYLSGDPDGKHVNAKSIMGMMSTVF